MTTTLASIDNKDREISLQFSFSNLSAIPQFLEDLTEENLELAAIRKNVGSQSAGIDLTNGSQFHQKMLDLRELPAGLLKTDYELVGAWKQKRIQMKKGWAQNKPYWMIRFRFCHKNHLPEYRSKLGEQAWNEMVTKKPILLGELVTICSIAFWQMRAWRNPWFQNGKLSPGVYFISLNFEGRKPLYEWDPPKGASNENFSQQFNPDAVFRID
ncbi:MAG: hypothetical protein ACD_11C00106G0013 [uncultured bacterium]|nr:MAG: hypothetical protein ACD_11C00106G0013 [uncultured bacterium]